ncbi:hypothetical protein FB451DRAFT_1171482 [Mycena latifolia]|nr:hypothetical protein FB451DRAFT_1171482 [Mycena latifolia]
MHYMIQFTSNHPTNQFRAARTPRPAPNKMEPDHLQPVPLAKPERAPVPARLGAPLTLRGGLSSVVRGRGRALGLAPPTAIINAPPNAETDYSSAVRRSARPDLASRACLAPPPPPVEGHSPRVGQRDLRAERNWVGGEADGDEGARVEGGAEYSGDEPGAGERGGGGGGGRLEGVDEQHRGESCAHSAVVPPWAPRGLGSGVLGGLGVGGLLGGIGDVGAGGGMNDRNEPMSDILKRGFLSMSVTGMST